MRDLLVALYSNDNAGRRAAEAAYNNALSSHLPDCVTFMLQTLANPAEVPYIYIIYNISYICCHYLMVCMYSYM